MASKNPMGLVSALIRNHGVGSQRDPLKVVGEQDEAQLLSIAKQYGECWVDTSGEFAGRILNGIFARGLINPVPRVARQPKYIARYALTPKGEAAK